MQGRVRHKAGTKEGRTGRADGRDPIDKSDVDGDDIVRSISWGLSMLGESCRVEKEEERKRKLLVSNGSSMYMKERRRRSSMRSQEAVSPRLSRKEGRVK